MQPKRSRSKKPSSMLDLHSDDKTLNGLAYSEESKESIRKSILPSHENSPRIESSIRSEHSGSLPAYKVMLPFSVTSSDIVDAFVSCAQKRKFQIVERTGSMVTAVLQPVKTWKSFLINCLPIQSSSSSSSNQITSIRLHIALNERKCMRTILAKGLSGQSGYILPLLQEFKGKLDKLQTNNRSPMRGAQEKIVHNRQISTELDEEPEVTCSSEATSYYQFYKLLSSESYTLGRSLAEFFESFSNQYRNIQESARLLPQPMESVKAIIEETIASLFSHFNYGRTQSERMMHFCRPAVEKFVFSKVYNQLYSIYEFKFRESNELFYSKSVEISSHPKSHIFDYLEIKLKFRLQGNEEPYKSAIKNLSKLESLISPIEKINCLLNTSTAMRTEVVDYYKGKVEISTMDDELPVLIYIYLHSGIKQLASELHFLRDYIAHTDRFDNEQRLLTNMEVILQYVKDEWHWPS